MNFDIGREKVNIQTDQHETQWHLSHSKNTLYIQSSSKQKSQSILMPKYACRRRRRNGSDIAENRKRKEEKVSENYYKRR